MKRRHPSEPPTTRGVDPTTKTKNDPDLREEYDFSGGVRAKHAKRDTQRTEVAAVHLPSTATVVYHLEMRDRTWFRPKAGPEGFEVTKVAPPSPSLNRRFYGGVGSQWEWTDRLPWSEEDWRRYVHRDALRTWVGRWHGQRAGYFELESQDDGDVEIVYFGLLPRFIGRGLGGPLLSAAVQCAWDTPAIRRVWVHTCTRDHPHALDNYRQRGFEVFKTEWK